MWRLNQSLNDAKLILYVLIESICDLCPISDGVSRLNKSLVVSKPGIDTIN